MPRNQSPNLIAGGTIQPSRFVSVSTTHDNTALQTSITQQPIIGISQVGPRDAPGLSGSGTQAADAGNPIEIFGVGDICLLQAAGSGGFTCGSWLTNDAVGQGRAATIGGTQYVGAMALETTTAGLFGRVQVVCFYLP